MVDILARLEGKLVVSCQPVPEGPFDTPQMVVAFAQAALAGGASGLRIEGVANLKAVRAVTDVPIIGLLKVDLDDSPVRISPKIEHITALIEAGADIIAFDATDRPRPEPIEGLVETILKAGKLAMADCSCLEDALKAKALGCQVLGSTMSGYTGGAVPVGPDLALVRALRDLGGFVIAEGRYQTPPEASAAIAAGANAVVAGSAITRPEVITEWFVAAIQEAAQ